MRVTILGGRMAFVLRLLFRGLSRYKPEDIPNRRYALDPVCAKAHSALLNGGFPVRIQGRTCINILRRFVYPVSRPLNPKSG